MYKAYSFLLIFLLMAKTLQAEKVCLVLSVQNDEDVVEECLENVKNIIDYVLVCDLGSSDQTKEKIHAFLKKISSPYEMVSQKNGIIAAQNFLQNLDVDCFNTYLLFLNSDAICEIDESFSKEELKNDGYWVLEQSDDFSHFSFKRNFLRASIQWDVIEPFFQEKLKNFSIQKNTHESYQKNRAQQQIKELSKKLKLDPYNFSLLLKLAGFYKYLHQYDEAIHFYQKCGRKSGFSNEIWFAKYMLGECFEALNDEKSSLYWYLEAYHTQNERIEPLRKLSKYYFLPNSETYHYKDVVNLEIDL